MVSDQKNWSSSQVICTAKIIHQRWRCNYEATEPDPLPHPAAYRHSVYKTMNRIHYIYISIFPECSGACYRGHCQVRHQINITGGSWPIAPRPRLKTTLPKLRIGLPSPVLENVIEACQPRQLYNILDLKVFNGNLICSSRNSITEMEAPIPWQYMLIGRI